MIKLRAPAIDLHVTVPRTYCAHDFGDTLYHKKEREHVGAKRASHKHTIKVHKGMLRGKQGNRELARARETQIHATRAMCVAEGHATPYSITPRLRD